MTYRPERVDSGVVDLRRDETGQPYPSILDLQATLAAASTRSDFERDWTMMHVLSSQDVEMPASSRDRIHPIRRSEFSSVEVQGPDGTSRTMLVIDPFTIDSPFLRGRGSLLRQVLSAATSETISLQIEGEK